MKAPALLLACASSLVPAAARAADTEPPVIVHQRVTAAPAGTALVVKAKIDDASAVFAPSVLVRPKGSVEYDTIELRQKGEEYEASIPAEQVTGDLEYFIEAFDEHGNGPAREGSPEAPIAIKVFDPSAPPPPPPPPVAIVPSAPGPEKDDEDGVHKRWWFWTIVGVAVAGGATAAYLIARPPGVVDFVNVTVKGPSPTGESR